MAIEALERAIDRFGTPLYVYHEIVHNRHVVDRFARRGVRFVDDLSEVPPGSNLIYSAHGVSPAVCEEARRRRLKAIDATCPLVAKVHREAKRFAAEGYTIVLIGHRGHEEVVGTVGEAPDRIVVVENAAEAERVAVPDPNRVAYLTQTTLSLDDAESVLAVLRRRFPNLRGPAKEDICYATQNRQQAVRELATQADLVVVVGSRNSSNSRRLTEVAERIGTPAMLIDGPHQLRPDRFAQTKTVLMTSGASTPEDIVQACLDWFRRRFNAQVREIPVCDESLEFALPPELR
jgi:4-hydroxy-3-methylbut-2-enyl diphosphate reductase